MSDKIKPQLVVKEERLTKLKELFPEIVADGVVNWTSLREALAEDLEDETQEHFGLSWPGKREAKKMAFAPPKGTLHPKKGEGINEDTTENIIIEGDNLEVLKLLQKSYFQRVKMIYIDPPYNTGNDFVYNDDFTDTVLDYLKKTGQLDSDGKPLSTNPKTSGRFHSSWLSMMYPRLVLAKNLLRDDGVVFISIDDNEVHNLREVMDEIFGEENFVATVIWQKIYSGKADAAYFGKFHEYVFCYAKKLQFAEIRLLPRTADMDARYLNPDNDIRGPWLSNDLTAAEERTEGHFIITAPLGNTFDSPQGKHWIYSEKTIKSMIEDNRIWFGKNGTAFPRLKRFLSEVQQGRKANTLWFYEEVGSTDEGTKELGALFPELNGSFETPKPTRLIQRMIQLCSSQQTESLPTPDIILDFFAGSGTTAQAVMKMNKEDGFRRNYILVQIPAPTGRTDFPVISEITKERVRRVIRNMNTLNEKNIAQNLFEGIEPHNEKAPADLGFRVLSLSESNLKKWKEGEALDLESLETQLEMFTDPLIPGWKKEDLLIEVLLSEGFALTSLLEDKKAGDNTFIRIKDPAMSYNLWICFDEKLNFTLKQFSELGFGKEDVAVFLDASLNDTIKSRLADLIRIKVL